MSATATARRSGSACWRRCASPRRRRCAGRSRRSSSVTACRPGSRAATQALLEAILDALQRDKKRTAAGVGFVLLSEPGDPRIGQLIEPDRVREAVQELFA